MTKKTITIRIKGKTVKAEGMVFLHCELVEAIYNRLIGKGFIVDIDNLFDAVIAKG